MNDPKPLTVHVLRQREKGHRLWEQNQLASRILRENPILDRLPTIVVVLNDMRQIVYYNRSLGQLLGTELQPEKVLGLRVGELMGCVYSTQSERGCESTEFCRMCGAVDTILTGLAGTESTKECSVSRPGGDALDMKLWAMPITIGDEPYVLLNIMDISLEKRRQVMERIFFHDILNTAGSIRGIAEILQEMVPEDARHIAEILFDSASHLVDEISWQKILVQVENGQLQGNYSHLLTSTILEDLVQMHSNAPHGRNKVVAIAPTAVGVILESDPTILRRVLGNMVKNALEAVPEQGVVTLDCQLVAEGKVCFSVHNPTVIDKDTQLQIFRRSFSTKGAGRGWGTYSIKLLSQRYLFGDVDFTSCEKEGTTFRATFPLQIPREDD
ncbi:MAG: HAMP domain-containing histidine kinase [Magnetococcales bacterium]|nr:HAMP domain-containing histidine kinase [Magnetococcales bacterium]NGZ25870.1 HAMP domain-containing histidine kinase [Magnetococcales bacterium]